MDIICQNCGEPWDHSHLFTEENLKKAWNNAKKINQQTPVIFGDGNEKFSAEFYLGLEEIEHFILLTCGCCKLLPECECGKVITPQDYDSLETTYHCPNCKKEVPIWKEGEKEEDD